MTVADPGRWLGLGDVGCLKTLPVGSNAAEQFVHSRGRPTPCSAFLRPRLEVKLLGVNCVACREKQDFIASLQARSTRDGDGPGTGGEVAFGVRSRS